MTVKPIKTETDYEKALERIDMLMDAEPGSERADELDVLVTLVEMYEHKHYPVEAPDPIEAIRFRMEQEGLQQKDLIPLFGSASRVSEVLQKKRALTLKMIRALHEKLKIPLESLVREYGLRQAGRAES